MVLRLINFMLGNTFLLPFDLSFIFGIISTLGKCRQHPFWWNRNKEFLEDFYSILFAFVRRIILPLISDHDGQEDWSNEDDVVDGEQYSGEDPGVQFVIEGYRPVELYKKKGRKGITLFLSIYQYSQYTHIHWLLSRFSSYRATN